MVVGPLDRDGRDRTAATAECGTVVADSTRLANTSAPCCFIDHRPSLVRSNTVMPDIRWLIARANDGMHDRVL